MTIADLKAVLPLPSIMERLGLGDRCKPSARCPFHSPDKRPSFGANKVNGTWLWNCAAGCGGGDEVTFLEKHFNLANGEAIARYKELLGGGVESRHATSGVAKPDTSAGSGSAVTRDTDSASGSSAPPAQLSPLTDAEIQKLATWRGYSLEFAKEIAANGTVGTYKGAIAFPVTGGCHFRVKADGSWRYSKGAKAELFVLGEIEEGAGVHCFESQWDALAFADRSGERSNIISTRGAGNAKLITGAHGEHTGTLYIWPQNDEPGQKWSNDIARLLPLCQVKLCPTPKDFKDFNDWHKSGDITNDVMFAWTCQAQDLPVLAQAEPSIHTVKSVSVPVGHKEGAQLKASVSEATTAGTPNGQTISASAGDDRSQTTEVRTESAQVKAVAESLASGGKADSSETSRTATLSTILDDCVAFFTKYIKFPEPWEPEILSLWAAHTWVSDAFEFTPYLHVCGPETNCGKSTVLKCVGKLARNPWKPIASPAALYLKVEKERPTLLLDELDAVFGDKAQGNEDLRAILNAGFERDGIVSRAPMGKVRDYNVFCPKALAGIGALPNTLSNRAIQIPMAKQLMNDMAVKLRERDVKAEAEPIAKFFAKWAIDNKSKLEVARPEMPKDLDGRYEDIVEPLIAIADLAGDQWAQHARDAVVLAFAQPVEDSNNVKLLRSCRTAFLTLDADKLLSEHLVKFLVEMVEADTPWPSWWERDVSNGRWHGAARRVAAMLKGFGIHPRDMRVQSDNHEDRGKGYCKADFENAWRRYVPADIQRVQNQLEL